MKTTIITIATSAILSSCIILGALENHEINSYIKSKLEITKINNNIIEIQPYTNQYVKGRIETLSSQVNRLQENSLTHLLAINKINNNSTYFTPSSKGFQALRTPAGNIVIMLDNIEKYANGYKLHFNIGNPTSASFSNMKMIIEWNKALANASTEEMESYTKNQKDITIPMNTVLPPARWTKFSAVISPATQEETQEITVKIDINTIALDNPR